MENIIISKVCGLCAGCNHAINTAKQKVADCSKVVLFKEIVHNPHVNDSLQRIGVEIIDDLSLANNKTHVVIRAHGEPPKTYEYLNKNNIKFSDCTCVNVSKIHDAVQKYSEDGYKVILIGKYGKTNGKSHPETTGTIGWCKTEPILIEDIEDTKKVNDSLSQKFYIACQTTFNETLADEIIAEIQKICAFSSKELIVNKSICNAQKTINKYSVEMTKEVDAVIVVGGKNSSNTRELFNNVKQYKPSIFIEEITDWQTELENIGFEFKFDTKIGLTAGASTPKEELLELKQLILNKQMELKNEN